MIYAERLPVVGFSVQILAKVLCHFNQPTPSPPPLPIATKPRAAAQGTCRLCVGEVYASATPLAITSASMLTLHVGLNFHGA